MAKWKTGVHVPRLCFDVTSETVQDGGNDKMGISETYPREVSIKKVKGRGSISKLNV